MIDPTLFDEIANKLSKALPEGFHELDKDLRQKFHAILQATFSKLDLVTREEFDIQAKVLAKTRQKLDTIEKQLMELELQTQGKKKK